MTQRPVDDVNSSATIVVGGTAGIGRATVDLLLDRGGRLLVVGLPGDDADDARASFAGRGAVMLAGDVTDTDFCIDVVAAALDTWGRIDGLVNCAAIRTTGTVIETDPATWARVFDVNVGGVYRMCRAALPAMTAAGGGAIVNVGSASAYGGEGHAAYCASKAAVVALSTSMALDHRQDHVRVNVVSPGSTRSPMNAGRDPRVDAVLAARSSVTGSINAADEVARVIGFLLSDEARAVTGTVVDVGYFRGEPVRSVVVPESP